MAEAGLTPADNPGVPRLVASPGNTAEANSKGHHRRSGGGSRDGVIIDEVLVPADLEHAADIRNRIASLAEKIGYPSEAVEEFRLAVGEAFVNAVRHGCRALRNRKHLGPMGIHVRVLRTGSQMLVDVLDPGPGFDLQSLVEPTPEDMRPGGRGILFMKISMDEVYFDFSEGTRVRLIKRLPRGS